MSIILFRVVITISSVFVMISLGYANKNTTDTTPHKKEGYIKRTFYNILNLKKKESDVENKATPTVISLRGIPDEVPDETDYKFLQLSINGMPDPHRDYMRKKTIQSRLEEEWQKNPVRGEYDITDDIPYENVLRTYDVLDEAHEINQAELKILKKYMKTESTDSDEVQKNKLNEMIAFSRKVKYTSDCLIELDKLKKKYEEPSN